MKDTELDALLGALKSQEPKADTFEQVYARAEFSSSPEMKKRAPSRVVWRVAGAALLAAALLLFFIKPAWPVSESLENGGKVSLSADGAIVAEPAAKLAYRTTLLGDTEVHQEAGRVFYRAPKGKAFSVHVPGGVVQSLGTSFSVDVLKDNSPSNKQDSKMISIPKKRDIAVGIASALLTTAVWVTVFEGSVRATPADGEAEVLVPGEKAKLEAGEVTRQRGDVDAPQVKVLKAQVQTLDDQLKRYMLAEAGKGNPVAEENLELRKKVAALEEEVEVDRLMRNEAEGRRFEFPEDLDDRYKSDALRKTFLDAIAATGVNGDVEAVDCSEFPCIVYGKASFPDTDNNMSEQFKLFQDTVQQSFPENKNHVNNSIWGATKEVDGKKVHTNTFGMAIYPKDSVESEEDGKAMKRRLRHRNTQFSDSMNE